MKLRTNYKYMDTRILIGLTMFQIENQLVVSCFFFGSDVVSYSSKKQPTIALSNTEAEYRGITIATCEVVW
jgi:hypothetical protein